MIMKTVVVVDDPRPLPVLIPYILKQQSAVLVVHDRSAAYQLLEDSNVKIVVRDDIADSNLWSELELQAEDRVILCFRAARKLEQCINSLLLFSTGISVAVIGSTKEEAKEINCLADVFFISLEDLVGERLVSIWLKIENQKRIKSLKDLSRDAESILILVQNDPDPDAIASGLALRVLLGRNKQTAPIGTFGEVTRTENMNMIELLDIPVVKVTPEFLRSFSAVAMVDVQPPYFKELAIKADIVIDHHPITAAYETKFSDIRTSYGATATILGQYLMDGQYKITQRLATALTYGIKTDTMFLERDISPADIEAFTYIYPKANLNMIRQIESATLPYNEISAFVKALNNVKIVDKMIFAYLRRVDKEDLIPRLADFCLQIGRAEWSFVAGIYNNTIICCVRNVGYVKHAGELVRKAFGAVGSAGGHRSMAKAVIPLQKFRKYFKVSGIKDIGEKIVDVLMSAKE
ncbi:MAG: DHH family phosphoesterase [Pseudomonadota bacterium]